VNDKGLYFCANDVKASSNIFLKLAILKKKNYTKLLCLMLPVKKVLVILFLLIIIMKSYSQNFTYKMLTVRDGLPGYILYDVYQDSRGYLWIGADGGLSRYDGSTFKNYGLNDGLPTNAGAFSFTEDSIGQLWFCTKGNACSFDGQRFVQYPIENPPANIWVNMLRKSSSGNMRFITGRDAFELQNNVWKKTNLFPAHPEIKSNNYVEIGKNSFLINCIDSLLIIWANGKTKTLIHINDDDPIFQCETKAGNEFYISTRNHLYILKNDSLVKVHDNVLKNNSILGVYIDKTNHLWVGTIQNGIYVFEGDNYQHFTSDDLQLSLMKCEDYEGNLWAVTHKGLFKITPSWVTFYTDSLNSAKVGFTAAFKDHTGTLYLANFFDGFKIIKNGKTINDNILLDKPSAKMTKSWIRSFACDHKERLWMVNNSSELLRITGTHCENMSRQWNFRPRSIPLLFNPFDSTLYANNYFGLSKIKNDKITVDTLFKSVFDYIYSLSCDSSGNTWIGTDKGKIFIKEGNRIRQLNNLLKIENVQISKIYWSNAHTLWIATSGKGIYKFHKTSSGEIKKDFQITVRDGLQHDAIRDIAMDKYGCLWAATLTGLARIKMYYFKGKESFSITKYGIRDGFNDEALNYSCLAADSVGDVWYGAGNYCAHIYCDRIMDDTIAPIIHIENVKLFSKETDWNNYTKSFVPFFHSPEKPVLPHDMNDISIEYKAITYNDYSNITYSYKTEAIDKDWVDAGFNTHITYGNLNPGKYVFKVRAKKPQSDWSKNYATFSFVINPPWWEMWWFRIIMAALILIAVYLLYRFRLNQLLRLQTIRNKIASDLHDDIGSTLQSISVFSEVAKQKSHEIIPELEEIGESSRKIIESLSDIVWSINPANDSFEKIIFRMKSHAFNLLRAKNIEFTFMADEKLNDKKTSMEERRNFYLIFKEALNNMVKYADSTRASIILHSTEKNITLSIKDNGKGFDTNQLSEGNGLKNMHRRANEMNSEIKIKSQPGAGTHIELVITGK
jgi:ligand-binding sensor domain-containing protein/two-component sensor histidine kinase